jgi:predicted DNA-binding transcriptional regulator AlpA
MTSRGIRAGVPNDKAWANQAPHVVNGVHHSAIRRVDLKRETRPTFGEQLRSPEDTARILDVSPSWLAKARMRGEGPRFVKIGRVVRYADSAIQDYIRARTRHTTSQG